MKPTESLEVVGRVELPAVVAPSEIGPSTVIEMMKAVIGQGVTTDNAAALEKLVGLCERMQDKDAERQFNAAFVKLQSELPPINASKVVPDRNGGIRYKYAPYEEIFAKAAPAMRANGFSVSFSTRESEGKQTCICTLIHVGGYSRPSEFTVRVGQGPPGATTTQADSSAGTVAQREAFCDALGIVRTHDNDARMVGGKISPEKADDFRRRVRDCGANEAAFLKLAGVASFDEIPSAVEHILEQMLVGKEKSKAPK